MLVHSTKYDGSLHYRFDAEVVAVADGMLALYRPPAVRVDSYRGSWPAMGHHLLVYWASRPYNLAVHWHRDWEPVWQYVNIATATSWHDGTLRWVDLDLDIVQRVSAVHPVVDDEDEFEEHRVSFGYPDELVAAARKAVAAVRAHFACATPPFDGSLYSWRPGRPLDAARLMLR